MRSDLWGHAVPLSDDGDGSRSVVPEPFVKRLLADLGVAVPEGRLAADPADVSTIAKDLRPPLVLKAWGRGILHKTELGAVRLGLPLDALPEAAAEMAERLSAQSITAAGFLVEQQAPAGVELIVGIVRRPPYGHLVMVGLGGTTAELYDDVVARLCPITADDAAGMLDSFRGASLLDGWRGQPAVDRDALLKLLVAVAGPEGLTTQLGGSLAEFECNPVIATATGATVADARLILDNDPAPDATATDGVPTDFSRLFAPRSVAVAGASTSRDTFGNWALAAYRDFGWTDGLYAVHPTATEVAGVPAYPSVADIPGGVDYLLAAVPAAACADLIAGAEGHVGMVQVISGGFGEAGPDGRKLEDDLRAAARAAGVRVIGPNCMGAYSPAGRQTFQLKAPSRVGRVSVISQSGGLAGDIVKMGAKRGIRFSKVVSAGNAIDVTPGELLDYLVDDPDTDVIGLYLEGPRDGERLIKALQRVRGRKPVTALVGGLSRQGQQAVASHTGSMTSDRRLWEAITAATGLAVVSTLEDLLGALLFLQRYAGCPAPVNPSVMAVGVGGGASVLAADACDRAGLDVTRIRPDIIARLREMGYGVGMSVVNPLEVGVGPKASPSAFNRVLDAILPDQPFPDVLLHVNIQSYYSYDTGGLQQLLAMMEVLGRSDWPATRLVLVARNLDAAPGTDVDMFHEGAEAAGLPVYRTFDEAVTAIAIGKRYGGNS